MNLITRSKINHDSLWLKIIASDKSEVKLFIGRTGVKISHKTTAASATVMREVANNVNKMFNELYKSGLPYGQIIEKIETAYKG